MENEGKTKNYRRKKKEGKRREKKHAENKDWNIEYNTKGEAKEKMHGKKITGKITLLKGKGKKKEILGKRSTHKETNDTRRKWTKEKT